MEKNRRNFLKIAGISALGLGTKPVIDVFASSGETSTSPIGGVSKKPDVITAKRWAMVVDIKKLAEDENHQKCIDACHKIHNVPEMKNKRHEIKWLWEEKFEHAFPSQEQEYLPENLKDLPFLVLCNHCENAPCVRVCPTKATFQREDGIVLMDFHRCIGCRFCMAACPYGSRSFNFRDPRPFIDETNPDFPTRMKGVVEKCNFCAERLAVGKMPACVEASDGALIFGDLDDPESEVREKLRSNYTIRRKSGLGTGPQIYYII
ncbi:Hdr-like menaquinol oxidoreductase iron-sulfur subunit 1 [Candidatus Magnetomoraceae bacterium gMMP-15]